MRRLILTADDFGLSPAVNEAVERAYRDGVLTATSLLVGAPAAADAVERARRNPGLRVGLHLAVTRCRPVLPASELPDITDGNGNLPHNLAAAGVRYFFLSRARAQLAAEIRAQFEAFRATGLPLDHVDGHNHMHLHPTVFSLLLRIGADYDLAAVRLPREPVRPFLAAGQEGAAGRLLQRLLLAPWTGLLAVRLRRARVHSNDWLLGLFDTGAMHTERVLALLPHLPDGTSEMMFHPAAEGPGALPLAEAACRAELETLLSDAVYAGLRAANVTACSFADLAGPAGSMAVAGTHAGSD